MNKRHNLLYGSIAITLIAIAGLFISCSEETDCSMTARSYAVCKFYKYGASKNILLKDTLPQLSISVLESDSILLNRDEKVHTWKQPLRYTKEVTPFVLHYGDYTLPETIRDTIWLAHTNSSFFVSIECGYQTRQNITEVVNFTKHRIDDVKLSNQEANNNGRENIKIIY